MVEKTKIDFVPISNVEIVYNKQKIILRPYLTISEKTSIASEYLQLLFDDESEDIAFRYLAAENALVLHIIDILTNISVEDVATNIDLLINSGLWDEIKKEIKGFDSFRFDLNKLISLYQSEKSLETALGGAVERVGAKLYDVLNNLSLMDAEAIKNAANSLFTELDKLNEKVPGITGPVKRRRTKKLE